MGFNIQSNRAVRQSVIYLSHDHVNCKSVTASVLNVPVRDRNPEIRNAVYESHSEARMPTNGSQVGR